VDKDVQLSLEYVSLFCDCWVLPNHVFHAVSLIEEFKLDLILALLHKEVANCSWNSVPDVSDHEREVLIDPYSELTNESGLLSLALSKVRSVGEIIVVVCKKIALFSLDKVF